MGRPHAKPDVAKSMYVRVRVSESERKEIARRWKKAKAQDESKWIRQRLLGDE